MNGVEWAVGNGRFVLKRPVSITNNAINEREEGPRLQGSRPFELHKATGFRFLHRVCSRSDLRWVVER
ncbi:unnamed protein product [Fusarium graminearum]|uniref:Uncharacterized protein n=1 Tax=Gibberella zeae TaxID=5518 RepID=A0A4E9DTK3_GIBZA|nr:unnamed protein product [Fusarium graminearum]